MTIDQTFLDNYIRIAELNERKEAALGNAAASSAISFEGAEMPELLSAFERLKAAIVKAKENGGHSAIDTDALFGLKWKVCEYFNIIVGGKFKFKIQISGRLRGTAGGACFAATTAGAGRTAGAPAAVAPLPLRGRPGKSVPLSMPWTRVEFKIYQTKQVAKPRQDPFLLELLHVSLLVRTRLFYIGLMYK